jgi:acetylornithine/succinyldiaminopimelate/putrescine aminotransferase
MPDRRWPTYPERGVMLDAAVPRDDAPDRGTHWMRAADGRVFLDAIGGIGCTPVGHAHPKWMAAIGEQLGKIAASANSFHTTPQQALIPALIERCGIPDARVFFCNTGTEATEAAIKCALRATGRDVIVSFERAFHGRTLGALSLTANPKYREPYLGCDDASAKGRFARFEVRRLPFGDLGALGDLFAREGDRIAGVFMEPIQGEAGIYPASREFLLGARALCTEHGALLGMDEIQSGTGRTGRWTAWQSIVGDEATPDLVWLAKALGGGFPIGACLARPEHADAMTRGSHGTTFGGNPVACAAALATIEIIEAEGLLESAAAQLGHVRALAESDPIDGVTEIRGAGAMVGIQIGAPDEGRAGALGPALMEQGLLTTICGGHTIRLLMPYYADRTVLAEVWGKIKAAVAATA